VATNAPNAWELLHDDAKSYVTLATALLGITATFADRLLSDDNVGRAVVIIGWIILAASIALSIYASGTVFAEIKKVSPSTDYKVAAAFLNAAVIALGIGVAALAFGAWRTSLTGDEDPPSPILAARRAIAEMTGANHDAVVSERLEKAPSGGFLITVRDTATGKAYEVIFRGQEHEVTSVRIP
jgi:hypothetical protein